MSVGEVAVTLDVRYLEFEILLELNKAPDLRARVALYLISQVLRPVFQSFAQSSINLVDLLGH